MRHQQVLRTKQRRFVEEYAIDHNATLAAIRAGYSPRSAYNQGYRLMNNDEVLRYIDDIFSQSMQVLAELLNEGTNAQKFRAADLAIKLWIKAHS